MSVFENSIISTYGNTGKAWLESLPELVKGIAEQYGLSALTPVNNLSYNYVLSGLQNEHPIILKLGLDIDELSQEVAALKAFTGFGMVKLLSEADGMLLLESAFPGYSLKSYFPSRDAEAINIVCNVMRCLHQAPIPPGNNFPHIKDWLAALDRGWEIPANYLQTARRLRDNLLETSVKEVLLHGDLHHDNILRNKEDMVIKPKIMIGKGSFNNKGVYACQKFKKGEVVIKYNLQLLSDKAFLQLPDTEKIFTHKQLGFIYLYSSPERYVNHSDSPNTYQDIINQCDIALRDIKKGEMITTDARKDDNCSLDELYEHPPTSLFCAPIYDWIVIDPKGVIGEPAYEVAAFIKNPLPELLYSNDAVNIIRHRIIRFAAVLGLPTIRILDWCFVQAVLSWVWALEDGCNADYFKRLTAIFLRIRSEFKVEQIDEEVS
jgi:streptomycin 6-kinase